MPTITDAQGWRHAYSNRDEEIIARMFAAACLCVRKQDFTVSRIGNSGLYELRGAKCCARWIVEPTMSPALVMAQGKIFAAKLSIAKERKIKNAK